MNIKHVSVSNFRGIKSLEWKVNSPVVCLIGPCDSNKTTILDAIEYCLYPSWNLVIDDSDFYNTDIHNEIGIKVTIGDVPGELLAEQKFGLYVRGWNERDGINDEPKRNDSVVLTVFLQVTDSLEPHWSVFNERSEGKSISHLDRSRICMNRLASYVDRHLSWSKGSTLARLTDEIDLASAALSAAGRSMRHSVDLTSIDGFRKVADSAKTASAQFGVKPRHNFMPRIDSKTLNMGTSSISIHDGLIPVRAAGLGTKRLVSLALQINASTSGSIVLVDEVEHGLEPFRLRHMLRQVTSGTLDVTVGQVIITTHSPITTVELPVQNLKVVRVNDGVTVCKDVPSDLQATVRAVPEALLARKVIVCEGKTEYGLVIGMEDHWFSDKTESLSYYGTATVEGGGGPQASKRAMQLAGLGYEVCVFLDSDKLTELTHSIDEMKSAGMNVVHWNDTVSTEQRLAKDLPVLGLQQIVDFRKEDVSVQTLRDSLRNQLNFITNDDELSLDTWISNGFSEDDIRTAIGTVSKNQQWFKRIDYGVRLGEILSNTIDEISESDISRKLASIKQWVCT